MSGAQISSVIEHMFIEKTQQSTEMTRRLKNWYDIFAEHELAECPTEKFKELIKALYDLSEAATETRYRLQDEHLRRLGIEEVNIDDEE